MSSRPPLTRVIKLPKHFLLGKGSHAPHENSSASSLNLLQYPMALAQPHTTVPILQSSSSLGPSANRDPRHSSFSEGDHEKGHSFSSSSSSNPPPPLSTSSSSLEVLHPGFEHSHPLSMRRWVREADELCVASMRRSERLESIHTYMATYKLRDPQWEPLLLPEVHVLEGGLHVQPSEDKDEGQRVAGDAGEAAMKEMWRDKIKGTPSFSSFLQDTEERQFEEDLSSKKRQSNARARRRHWNEVYINYNKMTSLELMSRHANFALKHIVQRGHAMYFITVSQHSLLAPRGLVEASHITCAYGVRGERLRTYMKHIGPLDARDVLHLDPKTRRVTWEWNRPNVPRGVVALSTVEGYGTWFQRKPMLWQRSRRIGALQAQMGTHQFLLAPPETVGRLRDYEVSLLEPHIRVFGGISTPLPDISSASLSSSPFSTEKVETAGSTSGSGVGAGGGAMAVGLIASSQVAQNPKLYMGQFEAPVIAALDAVHQLAHRSALHHHLVRPPAASPLATPSPVVAPTSPPDVSASPAGLPQQNEGPSEKKAGGGGQDVRARLHMEQFLPISWTTRTPPPYVPLEGELPFSLQLSRPSVLHLSSSLDKKENGSNRESSSTALPASPSTIGSPLVRGRNVFRRARYRRHGGVGSGKEREEWVPEKTALPVAFMEFIIHQGVDHYVFDDSPSSRPMKWWNQKSNMPYNGYMYCMRSSWLDDVEPALNIVNPLRSKTRGSWNREEDGYGGNGIQPPKGENKEQNVRVGRLARTTRKRQGIAPEIVLPGESYVVGHRDADWHTNRCPAHHSSSTRGTLHYSQPPQGKGTQSLNGNAESEKELDLQRTDEEGLATMQEGGIEDSMSSGNEDVVIYMSDNDTKDSLCSPTSSSSVPLSLLVPPNPIAAARVARYQRAAMRLQKRMKRKKKHRFGAERKESKEGQEEEKK